MSDLRGILLVNTGTPQAPTPAAVRRYLAQFLSDPRVVEAPRWWWLPLLHGLVLPLRSGRSAAKYRGLWTPEGSPLAVETARQAAGLQKLVGPETVVAWAMRYQNPSVALAWGRLKALGCRDLTVLPLFPQVSGATVASVFDEVTRVLQGERETPRLRFLSGFHRDPGYRAALAGSVRRAWGTQGRGAHLLLTYHGLPRSFVQKGDPYADQCRRTSEDLARALGLDPTQWTQSFQSRFGNNQWLGPSTLEAVVGLARSGVKHLDVACPSFVSDCLETTQEIGQEARRAFLGAGGTDFSLIPCLGSDEGFLAALARLTGPCPGDRSPEGDPA